MKAQETNLNVHFAGKDRALIIQTASERKPLAGVKSSAVFLPLLEAICAWWGDRACPSSGEREGYLEQIFRGGTMSMDTICPHGEGRGVDQGQEFGGDRSRKIASKNRLDQGVIMVIVLLLFIEGAVGSFLIGLAASNREFQDYLPATCTILQQNYASEETNDKYHQTYYVPVLTYLVHTSAGQQTEARGYSGPATKSFDDPDEARKVAKSYHIGQNYPCWYKKAHTETAVLELNKDNSRPWIMAILGAFVLPMVVQGEFIVIRVVKGILVAKEKKSLNLLWGVVLLTMLMAHYLLYLLPSLALILRP